MPSRDGAVHRGRSRTAAAGIATAAIVSIAAWVGVPLAAHEAITTELTWTRDVSRIVHKRCTSCHSAGGSAPMPLTTYDEARPWAKAIKREVLTRRMPPWGAVKGFGAFRNDRSLSIPEIAVISSWVEGGAPEGDAMYFEPYHSHGDGGMAEEPIAAGRLRTSGTVRLERDTVALGASSVEGLVADWAQLAAHLPDGRVEHLLWLRGPWAGVSADYWFLRPVELPAGTKLACQPPDAAIDLRVEPNHNRASR